MTRLDSQAYFFEPQILFLNFVLISFALVGLFLPHAMYVDLRRVNVAHNRSFLACSPGPCPFLSLLVTQKKLVAGMYFDV